MYYDVGLLINYFSPLYDYIDICTCTNPSSLHINAQKKKRFQITFFSRLGGHMAASSTHGRFSGISWTLSFTKQSLFSCF